MIAMMFLIPEAIAIIGFVLFIISKRRNLRSLTTYCPVNCRRD